MAVADEKYVTVKVACEMLGIAPNTLRSWGSAGKIDEFRHPINNYRLFRVRDVVLLRDRLRSPVPAIKSSERDS